MNSDKRPGRSRGNAMIYILLALALLGALTMAMMRGNETGGDDITDDQAELLTTKVIAYAASAKNVVDQMMMSGSPVASLDFVIPSDPTFNTGSNIHKVYHPAGGGLGHPALDPKAVLEFSSSPAPGWYMVRFNNVEWTPSAANDVLITAYQINQAVCEKINKKITGTTTIPAMSAALAPFFLGTANGAASDANITDGDCADCIGYPSLCVSNDTGDGYAYYNIISGQ